MRSKEALPAYYSLLAKPSKRYPYRCLIPINYIYCGSRACCFQKSINNTQIEFVGGVFSPPITVHVQRRPLNNRIKYWSPPLSPPQQKMKLKMKMSFNCWANTQGMIITEPTSTFSITSLITQSQSQVCDKRKYFHGSILMDSTSYTPTPPPRLFVWSVVCQSTIQWTL